jgi:hypothetical protein
MTMCPRAAAAATLSLLLLAGCGDDDSTAATSTTEVPTTAAGDLATFCDAGAEIESSTAIIDSPASAITVFGGLDATIDEMVAAAPPELADDAQAFADHVDDAVASGDFAAFEDGTVDALVTDFQAACTGEDQ